MRAKLSDREAPRAVDVAQSRRTGRRSSEVADARAADRLHEQAALLDHARDAIVVRDLEHRITYANKSAERQYGWTAEEVVGRAVLEFAYQNNPQFQLAQDQALRTGIAVVVTDMMMPVMDGATAIRVMPRRS